VNNLATSHSPEGGRGGDICGSLTNANCAQRINSPPSPEYSTSMAQSKSRATSRVFLNASEVHL